MIDDYNIMLQRSYGYDEEYQINSPEWKLARKLYDSNYLEAKGKKDRIPKKIHQIWLGSELPEEYRKYTDSWKVFHPDWDYKLWRDSDVINFPMVKRTEYDKATNQGMKSDILRYEILKQFGGIYVDTDFECLKPFDDLIYLDFFTSLSYDVEMQLYIGLIACTPAHPVINECVEKLTTSYRGDSSMIIMSNTGAYHFTKCFLEKIKSDTEGVVAFPMDFFYPLPNTKRDTLLPYLYTKPFSYAIHHWKVSWIRKSRRNAVLTGK
jgi:inositol phosphorylceramide mannosyltransferase catalytic subunit